MIKGKIVNTIKECKIPIFDNTKEIGTVLENIKNSKDRGNIKNLLLSCLYSKGILRSK